MLKMGPEKKTVSWTRVSTCFMSHVCKGRPLINSDYNVVHVIPVNETKLNRSEAEKKAIRTQIKESRKRVTACLDCTGWEMTSGTMITFIFVRTWLFLPEEIKIYPNNKSYVTGDIKDIINAKKMAF